MDSLVRMVDDMPRTEALRDLYNKIGALDVHNHGSPWDVAPSCAASTGWRGTGDRWTHGADGRDTGAERRARACNSPRFPPFFLRCSSRMDDS